jgi:tripartite-type tricarboxylate transporter receptor subunit TctC
VLDLYHNDTSTCAQKVRVTLAEKSHPQAKARFAGLGAEPEPMSRTAFEAHLKKQVARWAMIIKESGVSTD